MLLQGLSALLAAVPGFDSESQQPDMVWFQGVSVHDGLPPPLDGGLQVTGWFRVLLVGHPGPPESCFIRDRIKKRA